MNKYPHLFSPLEIRNVRYKNRIIAGPSSATGGNKIFRGPDERQILYYEGKARGGAAGVTTSECCIDNPYASRKSSGNIASPLYRRELMYLAAGIARHGAVPSIEIFHAGDLAEPKFNNGRAPRGPNTYVREDGVRVEAFDEAAMEEVARDFAKAAVLLKECGFQAIMIHGAHGWLFSQFLSPATNWRTDEYGGSIENRARFPLRILKAIRDAVGNDLVVEFRMSGDEHMENGITLEDVCRFAEMAQEYIDIIHMSAGSYYTTSQYTFPGIMIPGGPEGCNLYLAKEVKKHVRIPVATVGGYGSDPEELDRIIRDGEADIIYMTRQLMADPETPNKWRTGREEDVTHCIRCMQCLGNPDQGIYGSCDINPAVGQELLNVIQENRQPLKSKVVIVGGGPGGMKAAITASGRGHEVILFEKGDKLGGTLNYISHDCHKHQLTRFKNHLIDLVGRAKIDLRLNTEATTEIINKIAPDALIIAVGSTLIVPKIPGLLENGALSAKDVEEHPEKIGDKIVVIGGGLSGCETGLHFAEQGKNVVVIEMGSDIAVQGNEFTKPMIMETFERLADKISYMVNTSCTEVTDKGVYVECPDGRKFIEADTVIYNVGLKPRKDIANALADCDVPFVRMIGDCTGVYNIRKAIFNGYHAALDVG